MKRIFTISGLVLFCFFFINVAFAQNNTIKGKVTDAATGELLAGVSVAVKGTTNGTQTDVNGAYTITAPSTATITFSYIGYATQSIAINGKTIIDIKLAPQINDLQQVVVIGYGTQKKIDNTGSVATIKGADVAKESSQNALSSLQGKVAGLSIINNGSPGASPEVTIRGLGTIGGSSSPLYVVDDVWYDDISFLNTADIDNISVLKDASSTAIFGIRGANGVVLITTKRGGKGKPVINFNGYVGWQKATNLVKMADATQYATAINELYQYNNITPLLFSNPSSFGTGTNWYNQILRNALVTNHELSIGGGSEHNVYNVSFGFLDQDGLVKTNNYKRYTMHVSDDWTVVKPLKIGFTLSGLSSESSDINGGIFHQLYGAAPTLPVYYSNGKYGDPNDYNTGDGNNYNPQATIDFYNQHSKNIRLTGNVYGVLTLLKDLKFKTSYGMDLGQAEVRNYTPVYYATLAQQSTTSSFDIQHTQTANWIWENTFTYDKTIGGHKITALAGMTAQDYTTYYAHGYAKNVPYVSSGSLTSSFPDTAKNVLQTVLPSQQPHIRDLSYFVRANYSYKDKYLLNASIRQDGSSPYYDPKTNGANAFGYFPSIGAGWVISNESFLKDQHIFDNLKLKASWGKVGNRNVPINVANKVVTADPSYLTAIFGNPQTYVQGASINTVVPPLTVWENAESIDAGLEASFLNNRLSFELGYYNRITENAIFAIPIPSDVGTVGSNIEGNQAKIRNRGVELLLTWKDHPSSNFSYSVSANVGINNNIVLNVLSGKNPIYSGGNGIANGALATRTVEGEPIGEFYGYQVAGIFQQDQTSGAQPTAKAGDFQYVDVNKDGVIDSRDRVVLGNPNPKINYGINTSFTYKHFDLALDFQGVSDVSIYNADIAYRYGNENFTEDFYINRWHGTGTSNTYPSVNVGSNANAAPNSFYVESGAYFRVRNAQLGYTFSQLALQKVGIHKLRIFANAQNPINIFGYKGFNPEVGNSGNPLGQGLDANVYPLYATYNFGVNLTF